MFNFITLRLANVSRKIRWHGDANEWTGADWSNAMCGEAGEAANIVKKLRRYETGANSILGPGGTTARFNTPPEEDLRDMLADELADIVLYADLLADFYSINLDEAIISKFNRVSEAQGFPERVGYGV